MKGQARVEVLVFAIFAGVLILTSCSSGPQPPKLGTAAYYWSAARENYAAGDYQKTIQHLESLMKGENEYVARARPWHMVLTSGMAKGYMELADYFEEGSKANRGAPTPFRRQMGDYRAYASQLALQFAHSYEQFEKDTSAKQVPLDFDIPSANATPPSGLAKIGKGEMPASGVLDDMAQQELKTAVLLETTRAVGAPDDTAKTQDLFKARPVMVPREVFVLEMARVLHDQAQLYSRDRLDQPNRVEFFATHAMDALKTVPESKDTKTLLAKIQKTLKVVKEK